VPPSIIVAGLSIDLGAPQRIRPAAGHAPASTRRMEKRRGKGRHGDGGRRALWTRRGEMQEIECVERG